MKGKSVLKKQAVKRKKPGNHSTIRRFLGLIGSSFVKFSFLLVGLVFISLLFLSLYQYLLSSPYIKLEQIVVKGVDEETKEELMEMLRLNFEESLLAINLDELKQGLEKHPWIRSVQLEKQFPHTLIIWAEKERPRALVVLGGLFYINPWGEIFKEVDQGDDIDYPVVTGISSNDMVRETQLKLAVSMLRLLESEKGPFSLKELSEIHFSKNENVSFYTLSFPAVIKLKGSDLGVKKDELRKVVKHLRETGLIHMVRAIDLNYRDGAAVSFREEEKVNPITRG